MAVRRFSCLTRDNYDIAFIVHTSREIRGADDPLMIDARRGIKEQRALVKQISCKLDLDFKEHTLELPVEKGEPIRVTMYVRSLTGVARWFARSVDSRHCIPHVQARCKRRHGRSLPCIGIH